MSLVEDGQAIKKLKHGNLRGLEWLVRQHQVRAIRTAYAIVRDQTLAEDVVQSAFLRLPEAIHSFELGRAFAPWFLRVVVHDAIAAIRRAMRSQSAGDIGHMAGGLESIADCTPPPEALVESAETANEMWMLLGSLPPEQRAVIVLRYYVGLNQVEIAEWLSLPEGTVRWRTHAGLRTLRGLLHRLGWKSSHEAYLYNEEQEDEQIHAGSTSE